MKIFKYNKGMTLVEIIISLAIFGVLAVVFMNFFLSNLVITSKAGDRSNSVANISGAIDNRIASSASTNAALIYTTSGPFYVSISFNDGSSSTVSGVTLKSLPEQKVQLKYFLPN